jgi:predicted HicB family RNase H-like nuclease
MIRMAPDQHVRVSAAAVLAGKSINAWAVEALDDAASKALETERALAL